MDIIEKIYAKAGIVKYVLRKSKRKRQDDCI